MGDRRAADLDERPVTASGRGLDRAGDEVLADPALAANQHGRVRVGDIVDELPNGAHLRASVEERTLVCGISPLHRAHECRLAEEDLNSRTCPPSMLTAAADLEKQLLRLHGNFDALVARAHTNPKID